LTLARRRMRRMGEMIELVARAICRNTNIAMEGVTEVVLDNPDFVIPGHRRFDKTDTARWKLYIPQALAAVESMKHYTFDMEQAGMAAMARGEPFEIVWNTAINIGLRQK
jgi:hypothetical protein